MRIGSDFYVRKISNFYEVAGKLATEITLCACGDNIDDPPVEMLEALDISPRPDVFGASGVMVLRVTNRKLIEGIRPGAVFHVILEEKAVKVGCSA